MPTRTISGGVSSTVSSGVTDTNDLVLSGGTEIVASGGITSATTIQFGGFEQVMAGGTAAATVISGGTLEIQSGASVGTGGLRFAGTGGTLTIDGTTMPTSTISGFVTGDTIDLAGVSFANGGSIQLGASNVLTLVEGGNTYNLNLDPGQNFAGKSFRLSSDGASGTDIQVVSGLSINVTYDSSVNSSTPAGFKTGIDYVVSTFDQFFGDVDWELAREKPTDLRRFLVLVHLGATGADQRRCARRLDAAGQREPEHSCPGSWPSRAEGAGADHLHRLWRYLRWLRRLQRHLVDVLCAQRHAINQLFILLRRRR
jgi:autotransporter passenger strand-loop-strand repeat protein